MKKMFVTGMILLGMNQMALSMEAVEKDKQGKRQHESKKKDYAEICCDFGINACIKCCGFVAVLVGSHKNK
jgi:hypothetical protein